MSTTRRRSPLWLRSTSRRPATTLTLLLLAAAAVAVAVMGPMLLRAAQSASLADEVRQVPRAQRSVLTTALAADGDSVPSAITASGQLASVLGNTRVWDEPSTGVATDQPVTWRASDGSSSSTTSLLAVDPDPTCGRVRFTAGGCPLTARQVAVPVSTAERQQLVVGDAITLFSDQQRRIGVTLVGVYDDSGGYGAVAAAPDALVGVPVRQAGGSLLLGQDDLGIVPIGFTVYVAQPVRSPLRLDDLDVVEREVADARRAALSQQSGESSVVVRSDLETLLPRIRQQLDAAAVLTSAVVVEAIALAWFALAVAIQRMSRARAVEWGIGRTRGSRRSVWLETLFAEPAIAVVVGAVAGFPLGLLAARVIASVTVGPGFEPDPWRPTVVLAAAATLAGSLVALVVASVRSATLPLPALLRESTEPRRLSRLALVAQTGIVLVTAVVIWAVLTQSAITGAQVGLLLPSLVALVAAVLALRLAVAIVRRTTSRPPRTLAGLVVGRGIARTPSVLTAAAVVAVGLSLSTYVLSLSATTERLQTERADARLGAATVLTVVTPATTSLLDAVRAADPGGRRAMAVREVSGTGITGTTRIVAVDTARLAAVTTWRPGWRGVPTPTLLRRLDPAGGTDLTLTGTRLSLTIAGLLPESVDQDPDVHLGVLLATPSGWRDVDMGVVRDGTMTSRPGDVPCADGCRLVSLSLSEPSTATATGFADGFTLTAISTDRVPASAYAGWLDGRHGWRQRVADSVDETHSTSAGAFARAAGLHLDLSAEHPGVTPAIEPDVGPAELPALLAEGTSADPFAGLAKVVHGSDLMGAPLLLDVIGRAPVLPRSLDDGALVDLGQLQRISDTSRSRTRDEVWLAPGPQRAVLASLRGRGVRIVSAETLAEARAQNVREAPGRALRLLLATSAGALVLTLIALIGVHVLGAEVRRRERRVLDETGIRPRARAMLAAVAFAVPTAASVLIGVGSGCTAYALTVARLPLLAGSSAGPPLDLALPVVPVAALGAAALLVVLAVAVVVLLLESRRSAS